MITVTKSATIDPITKLTAPPMIPNMGIRAKYSTVRGTFIARWMANDCLYLPYENTRLPIPTATIVGRIDNSKI